MAFIDKNSTAYQQFSKWQKWLSRFSQNAWIKLLYALIFLALCAENIAIIFNLNFISFNKSILPCEIIYLCFIQYGWLYSWYTIVNDNKYLSQTKYKRKVRHWQIFTIIVLLSSIFALFNSNNLIGILIIDLAFLLSWLYYESIICNLHIFSNEIPSIKMCCNDILTGIGIIILSLELFLFVQLIFVTYNQPVLLSPIMVTYSATLSIITVIVIIGYVIPRYSDTDSYIIINWQDVKHYNSNPKNKLQSLSYHMHNTLNGQHAHAIYAIGAILVINGIFEYFGYVFWNNILKDRLENRLENIWDSLLATFQNVWASLLATLQNMALPIFIGVCALITIAAFYVYLFRQDH